MQNYFGDAWNVFDFIVVLGSFIDIMMSEIDRKEEIDKGIKKDVINSVAASNSKVNYLFESFQHCFVAPYFPFLAKIKLIIFHFQSKIHLNVPIHKFHKRNNLDFNPFAEHFNNTILPTVSCDAFGKIAESRRGYSNATLDIYQIISSASVRCIVDRDAVLHLCGHWNAGK